MTYDIVNQGPGLGQAQQCDGVKPANGIPTLQVWVLIEPGKHCLCKSAEHSILIFVHFQSGTWQIQFMVILAKLKKIYIHQQKSKWFFKGYASKTISIGILYLSEFLPHLSQRLKMSISDGKVSGIRLSMHMSQILTCSTFYSDPVPMATQSPNFPQMFLSI